MKNSLPILTLIIGIGIGSLAGHFHGKAEVYSGMFDQHALVAEALQK